MKSNYKCKWNVASIVPVALGVILFATAAVAHADVAPVVTTVIQDSNNVGILSAPVGGVVHNFITVAPTSTATTTPQGTADFNLFPNTTCSGTPTVQSGVALVNGMAESSTTTVPSTGLSYTANYSGQSGFFTAVNGPCEPLMVTSATSTQNTPTIATVLSTPTIVASSSAFDTATLSGATANASGTVSYVVYNDSACSLPAVGAGVMPVTNAVVPNSLSIMFPVSGTFFWQAMYSGDTNNAAATSTCANEPLTVTAATSTPSSTPTISTALSASTITASSSAFDTAMLSGATTNAGGNVSYVVYNDSACSVPVEGAGVVSVTNAVVPNSQTIMFPNAGTFYWQAMYSGDANNVAATSTCNEPLVVTSSSTTTPGTPTISTLLSTPTSVAPASVYDTAALSGATSNASGTVAYNVYTDNVCSALMTSAGVVSVTNATIPNSQTIAFPNAGTFYWQAMYSGDANNAAATSTCINEPLVVTSATGTPTSTPGQASISGTVYNDLNRNGVKDSGEPLLPGWTINLYSGSGLSGSENQAPIMTMVSDVNGFYSFNSLADGTYSIEEINQPSLNQFTSDYFSVVISNGTSVTGEDFGNVAGNPNVNVRKIHHQDHHEMIKADEHNGGGFSGGPSVSDNQGRDNRPVVDPVPTPVNDNGNQGNHGDGGHAGHFDHGNGRGHSRDN